MKRTKILIILFAFLAISNIHAQQDVSIGALIDMEVFTNYGDIDTYDNITDGYSQNGNIINLGFEIKYQSWGIQVKRTNLKLHSDGFEHPYNLLRIQSEYYPKPWSEKIGFFSNNGYSFAGFSFGLLKVFHFKYFDLQVVGEYGVMDTKNNHRNPYELFSYSYDAGNAFNSKHWAIYDGGHYFAYHIELGRKIYKGLSVYCGAGHRFGSFQYVFSENITDSIMEENSIHSVLDINRKFNSVGIKFGIKYNFDL
ncbi:MAG: hypothetical protein K9I85_16150 [Saprospiraceae bacterium]|nr:hypothetical protein [Saprospiraceae bacterium]